MSHLHHKVSALVDGELSPAARSRALAHARTCPQCRQEIAETLEVKRRLHKMAPVEISDDLLHVVAVGAPLPPAPPESGGSPLLRRALVGVGSLSAVMIVVAYVVGAPAPAQQRPVSPSVEEFAAEFTDSTGRSPFADPMVELTASPASSGVTSPIGLGAAEGTRNELPGDSTPAGLPALSEKRSGDARAALRLLRRAVLAPQRIAFHGIRVVESLTARGAESAVVEITHSPGQGTRFDVADSDASEQAWFVSDTDSGKGVDRDRSLARLTSAYDLHMDGSQRLHGRAARVISVSQDGQVSARFWIDEATGLLLRKEMYVDGRLVRWSGYSSLDTGSGEFMEHLPPQMQTAPTTSLSTSVAAALNDKGWTCPEWLTRDFRLVALHQVDADGGVMHAEYGDGMSTVSVFEERGSLDPSSLAGFRSATVAGRRVHLKDGLPTTVVWQSGDTVYTVVTDAPEQLVGQLVARFPDDEEVESHGVLFRIGSGLTRMASAVTR